jgi:hypothetical protein
MIFRVPTIMQNLSRVAESLRPLVRADGTLRAYTEIGCYPIFYVSVDNDCLCPTCASKASETLMRDSDRVVACDVNWEDPDLLCDACETRIESAYAEDESEAS